jgi:hypothetical protein
MKGSGIRSAHDFGRNEFEHTGFMPWFRKVQYTVDDLTLGVLTIPVEARTMVLGAILLIDEAFNGAVPAVEVGVDGNPDAFIAAGDVDPAVVAASFYSGGSANALAQGSYFADAALIIVSHNIDAAEGAATLLIHELGITDNWRSLGDIGQLDIASM